MLLISQESAKRIEKGEIADSCQGYYVARITPHGMTHAFRSTNTYRTLCGRGINYPCMSLHCFNAQPTCDQCQGALVGATLVPAPTVRRVEVHQVRSALKLARSNVALAENLLLDALDGTTKDTGLQQGLLRQALIVLGVEL